MRARFPLLLLLGIVFLASVSVSLQEKPSGHKCLQSCESETDPYKRQACKLSCEFVPEREEQQEKEREREHPLPQPHPPHEERGRRERGRQEGEKEEEEQYEREDPRPVPHPHEHEGEQWRGKHRREDPEERERVRQREEERREREREEEERLRRREKKQQREEKEQAWEGAHSQRHKNPFHFSSHRFQTLFKNQHGHIRVLQRFNKRSPQLQNLRDYRVVELVTKPNTLLLPHHADADFLLICLSGRALIHFVKPDGRDPYYLDRGYAQRIPAGTTLYLVNPDKKKDLRLIKLAIPVNKPGKFENFFLSSTQDQQSYLQGFSENVLEASFNAEFEEINRVLFGGEKGQQQEGVIVEMPKEQIRELSKRAKSSSGKTNSFEYEPFYLRGWPIYSNNFGEFYEIAPEKNPQLRDLDIFLNTVDIKEGGLLLPHFNSKAIVILVVNEGNANIELVGLKEQKQKQQEEEEPLEMRRYRAELSENDIFVIPSAYPVVINATSNLNFVAFGINAENNQRNFLAGEKDNVIRHIQRQVKELAFPGSAQDVEKLIKNQRESYFVDAQPQQKEEGRKGPLSSILGALY